MTLSVAHTLTIPAELAGRRLDQALAELLPDYSRSRIKDWIDAGQVLLDGRTVRPKERVVGSEHVEVRGEMPGDDAVVCCQSKVQGDTPCCAPTTAPAPAAKS